MFTLTGRWTVGLCCAIAIGCGGGAEDVGVDGIDASDLIDDVPAVLDETTPSDTKKPHPSGPVLVYVGTGTWGSGVVAITRFLDFVQYPWLAVEALDVIAGHVFDDASALWVPGGWAPSYTAELGDAGLAKIRDFVDQGGGYIGTCAGAYLAATQVVWEGESFDYPLGLWSGTADGPQAFPWPEYGLIGVRSEEGHPLVSSARTYQTLLYGGSRFDGSNADEVVARYTADGTAAAIIAAYGTGHVLLMGFHGEIEEGSDRDGAAFGDDIVDPESEWPLLETWVGWVAGVND